MIPGEYFIDGGELELNAGRATMTLEVANTGDRPVQVGSHYHFSETNTSLDFDREAARGFRLDIPAGTAVRFEPGQTRRVELVALGGTRHVYGFQGRVMGALDAPGAGGSGSSGSGSSGGSSSSSTGTGTGTGSGTGIDKGDAS